MLSGVSGRCGWQQSVESSDPALVLVNAAMNPTFTVTDSGTVTGTVTGIIMFVGTCA